MRKTSETDIAELGEFLGVSYSAEERADAADRLNTLAGIYQQLEAVPAHSSRGQEGAAETFESRLHVPDEDPHNAWLTRFDLVHPEREGVLSDLTVAIKDNTCVRGVEMTCGSRALEGFAPVEHAEVVERVLDQGGRIVGKTNMDEFAFGPTSETSAFGPTRNPVDPDHVAGGSSSGSASAVAAGDVDLALGTDTGGSVRIPASYCGIVGMKPTYGHVPLHGVAELAYSMDHVGTLARNVEIAARGLKAIADPHPNGTLPEYDSDLGTSVNELTIGVVDRFFEEYVDSEVEQTVRAAVNDLKSLGAMIEPVSIPALEHSRPGWWGIAPLEFASMFLTNGIGLWRVGPQERGFPSALARLHSASSSALGLNIKEMLALGARLLVDEGGSHYIRARNYREKLTAQFNDALSDVDVLAAPSTPTTAQKIGGFERGVTPPVNWNTHPTNLTGHPSISLPCGELDDLPVGLQLIGRWWDDSTVLDLAYVYEQDA